MTATTRLIGKAMKPVVRRTKLEPVQLTANEARLMLKSMKKTKPFKDKFLAAMTTKRICIALAGCAGLAAILLVAVIVLLGPTIIKNGQPAVAAPKVTDYEEKISVCIDICKSYSNNPGWQLDYFLHYVNDYESISLKEKYRVDKSSVYFKDGEKYIEIYFTWADFERLANNLAKKDGPATMQAIAKYTIECMNGGTGSRYSGGLSLDGMTVNERKAAITVMNELVKMAGIKEWPRRGCEHATTQRNK